MHLGSLLFRRRTVAALLGGVLLATSATLALVVPSASAAHGPSLAGKLTYPSSCAGFEYRSSIKVGDTGVVKVYWKGSTQQNCVVLEKTKYVGKPTATILVACSTALPARAHSGNVTGAECTKGVKGGYGWAHAPVDYGNFSKYAGPIVVKAPGCLYIGAYTSSSTSSSFKTSTLKGGDSVTNLQGSGKYGC